ncbi:hypothetical protein GQX74_008849 [Glossina fuscipes]|nr:hypothetical protein GQX74_008849 [Glossina fuscipes]
MKSSKQGKKMKDAMFSCRANVSVIEIFDLDVLDLKYWPSLISVFLATFGQPNEQISSAHVFCTSVVDNQLRINMKRSERAHSTTITTKTTTTKLVRKQQQWTEYKSMAPQ